MTRFILAIPMTVAFAFAPAFAKKKPAVDNSAYYNALVAEAQMIVPEGESYQPKILDDNYYKTVAKDFDKIAKRKVSNTVSDIPKTSAFEADFKQDFIDLRKALIGIDNKDGQQVKANKGAESPERLQEIINEYSSRYNSLSPEAKMVVLQLRGLVPYKSFFVRAKAYFGSGTAIRSAIVTMLRNSAVGLQVFFPTGQTNPVNHWNVVFRYMTEPMAGMGPPIKDDKDLQDFTFGVIKSNGPLLTEMEKLLVNNEQIWWDNKLYASFANFTNEKDRYTKLGKIEMSAILSGAYAAQSGLQFSAAYSFEGLAASIRTTSSFFGMEQFGNSINFTPKSKDDVHGLKSKERFQTLRHYPTLFVRRGDYAKYTYSGNDKEKIVGAFQYLKSSVRYGRESWKALENMSPESRPNFLIDPGTVTPFNRFYSAGFQNLADLIEGREVSNGKNNLSTVINGEVISMNLEKFYAEPPSSMSVFYPVAFDNGPEEFNNKPGLPKYRNYLQGSPVAWDASAYKPYFSEISEVSCPPAQSQCTRPGSCPEVTVVRVEKCTRDVSKYARILSQTLGVAGFGAVMAGMVF